MGNQPSSDKKLPDIAEFSKNLVKIAAQSQQLLSDFLKHQNGNKPEVDPLNIGGAFQEMAARLIHDPNKMAEATIDLWKSHLALWSSTAQRMMGGEAAPPVAPAMSDRRFKDPAWEEIQLFDFIKQSYLLSARWLQDTVRNVEGLDGKTARKVDFYTRQFVDAMAPSNFVLTNPAVLRATLESNGENLVRGLENMLEDLERGKGQLSIKMTDHDAFEIGVNVAVTPGKVVFQNDLIQLLQYNPTTEKVYRRPLLIVPPWINKFYVLDLRQDNSFIKWAVAEGYTVFVISWVNPTERLADKDFESYMNEGVMAALAAMEAATGEREASIIGYCIGGTLVAAMLAYMAAIGDDRIKAATFFAGQVDFVEAGELQVFVDEDQLKFLDRVMGQRGYLEGSEMATTFNLLRANDLIWSFVINNYLLGKEPFPFDLLFWNSDATRMPRAMHSFYLRNMYQKNLLSTPDGINLNGVPIDLRKITIPTYIQSSKEDHIAPFRSVYKAVHLYGGPVRFVLAGSGHIAGVINPPSAKKYQHWLNETKRFPENPEDWLKGATEIPGSWWEDWHRWLSRKSGGKVSARVPGDHKLKVIEDAPGSYVKVRSN